MSYCCTLPDTFEFYVADQLWVLRVSVLLSRGHCPLCKQAPAGEFYLHLLPLLRDFRTFLDLRPR